jgi:hypothetical protein
MTRVLRVGALAVAVVTGCASGRAGDSASPASARQTISTDASARRACVRDWAGPWTSECSARWVARVVRRAGFRVTRATGSAWVAAGRGRHFFIWATERAGSVERLARRESYRLLFRVAEAPVYGDGVRKFWPAGGFILWVAAGPRGDSIAPTARELAPLVRASRTLPSPRAVP